MVRRIKAERWEAFLDEYRPTADKDSDWVMGWCGYHILADKNFARIYRVMRERRERIHRRVGGRPGSYNPWGDAAWAHQAYGRKGKNKWRVK
jgi:hypothetical protein